MDFLCLIKDNFWEIFSFVTGVVYVLLEIRQKNSMWILGMFTSAATVYVFFMEGLYASSALNVYYFAIAFWGLYQWRKDMRRLAVTDSRPEEGHEAVHLNRITPVVVWTSAAVCIAGTAALSLGMACLGDPMSVMDAAVTMLSAVATWWLGRSYVQQWLLWIAADLLTFAMCLSQGLFLMAALYVLYTVFAAVGYFHWKRYGVYL